MQVKFKDDTIGILLEKRMETTTQGLRIQGSRGLGFRV